MGNIPFSPLSSEGSKRQEIQVLAETLLATFTKEYTAAYAQEYTKHLVGEVDNNSGPVEGSYLLLQRDICSLQKPKKTGMLTKRGDVVKNWKHRFFVVRSNYSVDYYESEESFKKNAKPKGTILPSGYKVVKDLENAMLKRTRKLAEKMGVDLSEIPAPDKYPDYTFELYHQRRRIWMMTAKNAEDMESWCSVFEDCCYHGCGYKNEDPIARKAFDKAMFRTRSECESDVYLHGGSEEQVLSDFIVAEVNHKTMGDVYSHIKGNWMIRSKIKEQVDKALDSAVMALVTPALKTLDTGIQQLRQNLEVLVAQKKDEMAAVERKVMWEMNEQIKEHVDKMLSDLKPDAIKLIEITKEPCEDSYDKSREMFIDEVSKLQTKFKEKTDFNLELHADDLFHSIDSVTDRWSDREIYTKFHRQLADMNAPRWDILNMARDIIKLILDSAVYTFQELFMGSAKDAEASTKGEEAANLADRIKDDVLKQYDCDRVVSLHHFLFKSIVYAIDLKLHKDLDPVCKPLTKSVQDVVPDSLDQVLSVKDMYEKYVNNAVKDMILKVLKEADLEPPKAGENNMSVKNSTSEGDANPETATAADTSEHAGDEDKQDDAGNSDASDNAGDADGDAGDASGDADEKKETVVSEENQESSINSEVEQKSDSTCNDEVKQESVSNEVKQPENKADQVESQEDNKQGTDSSDGKSADKHEEITESEKSDVTTKL